MDRGDVVDYGTTAPSVHVGLLRPLASNLPFVRIIKKTTKVRTGVESGPWIYYTDGRFEDMPDRATRLAEYCEERLGDGLRAVGYHSDTSVELAYVRADLEPMYPPERVERFIESSRSVHRDVEELDDRMGTPEASLHVLEEGLIIQFHFSGDEVVFLSMDRDVGRNFTRFIRECLDEMS